MRFGCARVRCAGGRVVAEKVHPVLLAAAQGGRALVAAGGTNVVFVTHSGPCMLAPASARSCPPAMPLGLFDFYGGIVRAGTGCGVAGCGRGI